MKARDLRRPHQILLGEQNGNKHKAQDDIHHRARDHDQNTLPHGLIVKCPLVGARLILALHLDIAAHGD